MSGRDHHWVRIGRVEKVDVKDCTNFYFVKVKDKNSDWMLCLKLSKLGSSKSAEETYTAKVIFGPEAEGLILKNDQVVVSLIESRLKQAHRSYFYAALPTTEQRLAREIFFSAWQPTEYDHASKLNAVVYKRWLKQFEANPKLDFREDSVSQSLLSLKAPEVKALDEYMDWLHVKFTDMLDRIDKGSIGCRMLAPWLNEMEMEFALKRPILDARSWALIFLFSQLLRHQICYATEKRAHYRESTFVSTLGDVMEEALEIYLALEEEQPKNEAGSVQ